MSTRPCSLPASPYVAERVASMRASLLGRLASAGLGRRTPALAGLGLRALGESRPLSVLALGAARAATGLRPRVSCGPFSPAALAALPTPAASSSPARPGGLLGSCRGISFRRRAGTQKVRWHKPATAKRGGAPEALRVEDLQGRHGRREPRAVQGHDRRGDQNAQEVYVLQVEVNVVKCKVWDHKTDPPAAGCGEKRPIHYSDVNLLDPVSQERTKVDFRYLETGERIARNPRHRAKPIFNKPARAEGTLASPFDTSIEVGLGLGLGFRLGLGLGLGVR